jgi:CubicO group peptidase (beta-lactamase class C family)
MKAYGNKSLVPEKTPMTTGTMFDMASVSKCVGTTLSFMQLIDRGRVRLTDNVSMYIPGFKPWIDPETGEKVEITIRDLMTHSSGLTPYVNVASFVSKYGKNQPDTLMKVISTEVKRNFRPGTKFMYSCLNFITLQHVLENVTGERLCDYAQQNVFDALGLKHTCYNPSGANLELCAPTEVQPDGLPLKGVVHDPIARVINNGNSGNAGVFSNAEDLSTIAIALLNGGALPDGKGERILSQAAVKTMITIPSENAPCVGRALGWDVKSAHSGVKGDLFSRDKSICHTGYTGTSMVIDFETNTAVILLTNRVHPHDVGSVGRIRALVANIVAGSLTDSRGFNVK